MASTGGTNQQQQHQQQQVAKHYRYSQEISQMMFVFGEVRDPPVEILHFVEDAIRSQVTELVCQARQITHRRSSRYLSVEDLMFLIRHDRGKVNRLRTYLSWKDVRKKAKDSDGNDPVPEDLDEVAAGDKLLKAHKLKVKIPWDLTSVFLDKVQSDSEDEEDEDELEAYEDSKKRLKEADDLTRHMSKEEYQRYADCRQASFTYRKGKRFRDFINFSALMDGNPNDEVVDVLGFLCYEMVRTLTEGAFAYERALEERRKRAVAPITSPIVGRSSRSEGDGEASGGDEMEIDGEGEEIGGRKRKRISDGKDGNGVKRVRIVDHHHPNKTKQQQQQQKLQRRREEEKQEAAAAAEADLNKPIWLRGSKFKTPKGPFSGFIPPDEDREEEVKKSADGGKGKEKENGSKPNNNTNVQQPTPPPESGNNNNNNNNNSSSSSSSTDANANANTQSSSLLLPGSNQGKDSGDKSPQTQSQRGGTASPSKKKGKGKDVGITSSPISPSPSHNSLSASNNPNPNPTSDNPDQPTSSTSTTNSNPSSDSNPNKITLTLASMRGAWATMQRDKAMLKLGGMRNFGGGLVKTRMTLI